VGALTALALGAVAVAQRDLKQLLAASTSAQLGFVVLAAGVGSVSGGMTFLMAHAATKALLFLAAGAWLTALGTKQLSALRGVARRWPIVGITFTIGTLSLAGLAPLSLWAAKDELLVGALEVSPALYIGQGALHRLAPGPGRRRERLRHGAGRHPSRCCVDNAAAGDARGRGRDPRYPRASAPLRYC
jgi:NADH:ubiquinone oxidoreductase subunit 5 (subunit L)/multisubunit Na+/H+ antiporter MnhA subunit